jgi:hypothetical protein
MTPNEILDIITLSRLVSHRYNLDEYENQAVKPLLKAVQQSQSEILARIQAKAGNLSEWSEERSLMVLDELSDLTLALRQKINGDITEITSQAGAQSYLIHNDILSFGNRVLDFNNVALTAGQIRQLLTEQPMGGKLLSGWIESSFDMRLQQEIRQTITAGLLQGEGYPSLVRRLNQGFDLVRQDQITLVRTYVASVNVGAQEAVYRANKDVVKGWKWCAALEPGFSKTGRGTCVRCACLDGQVFQEDDALKPEIPLHPRCLTPETPVFAPDKIAAFVSTYCGPVFEIGLSDGRRFTVTPNHMFLTPNGFTPAKSLRKGGNIISSALSNGPPSLIGPNNDRNQARIDETVEAFAKTPGMRTVGVPHAPENFHGDGEFIKGYIEIIMPDSLLRGDFEAFSNEHRHKLPFPFAGELPPDAFTALSNFYKPLFWLRLATGGFVSGKSVSDMLIDGPGGHHKPIGFHYPPQGDSFREQPGPNGATGNIELFGDGILRHAGQIGGGDFLNGDVSLERFRLGLAVDRFDSIAPKDIGNGVRTNAELLGEFARTFAGQISLANISFIRERNFTGHVYDLQTLTSLYYINWTIASNCRCMWLPELVTWRELGINMNEMEEVYRPYTMRPDKNIGVGGTRTIEEVGFHQGSYSTFFDKQSRAFQLNAVGPGRLELLESGKVQFGDLVTRGGKLRTLKELEGL